jgi:hypothetical protein
MQPRVGIELVQVVDVVERDLARLDRLLEQLFDVLVDARIHSLHYLVKLGCLQFLSEFWV